MAEGDLSGTIDPDRLREFMNSLPDDSFYRVKGILRLPSGPFLVERTLDGWDVQPIRAYKDGAESFMVFIARSPDEESLRSGLERCVIQA
jgi:G3E family GTPase